MRVLPAVLLASLLVAGLASATEAQSLGDIAQQEAARRKTVAAEGKVYTNKDLRAVPPPAKPAAAPSDQGDAQTTASGDAKPSQGTGTEVAVEAAAEPKKDQAYWQSRLKDLQTALDRSQTYADALQSRVNGLTTDFASRDDPAQRSIVAADRERALSELDRLKKEMEDTRRAITALQEDARRARVPAGWLR